MTATRRVVRDGDRAVLVGTVVRTSVRPSTGVGVADDTGPGPVLPELDYPPISVVVPILGPAGHAQTWEELIGRRLRVRGTWTSEGIVCDPTTGDVAPLALQPEAEPVRVAGRELRTPGHATARAIEGPLFESGDLIWRVPFSRDGEPVVLVAAHDKAAVEDRLRQLHGDALHVVQSPWTREEYLRADRFGERAEAQGLLISVEQGLDLDDGVVRYVVRLTALTDQLAAEYDALPAGLARLETLVAPDAPGLSDGPG
ncbi:hypothetical protein H9623_16475 [Oerskovia sp. Sa1BUA8]|uniref:Uncharacterized protein n=1 Tax=Oerskovia douganii TaxID=2762210 RepID=A0A9D5Z070_9CELL|nr:hypothetical protein [Oerskovia douganii]MBE7701890.1 hypothetical protein [Oerskovia douganii]